MPAALNPNDFPHYDPAAILDTHGTIIRSLADGGTIDIEALHAQGMSPLTAETAEGQILSVVNPRIMSVDLPFTDSILASDTGEVLSFSPEISGEGFVGYRGDSGKIEYFLTRLPLPQGATMAAAAVSYNQDDSGTFYVYFFQADGEIVGRITPVFAEGERPSLVADTTRYLHLIDPSGGELVYDLITSHWVRIDPTATPTATSTPTVTFTPDPLVIRESARNVYNVASHEWQRVHGDSGGYNLTENEDGSSSLSLEYTTWEDTVEIREEIVRFNPDGTAILKNAEYPNGGVVRTEDVVYDKYYQGVSIKESDRTVYVYVHELDMWLSTELRGGVSADLHAAVMLPDFDNREDFIPGLLDVERQWVESNRINAGEYYCPIGSAQSSDILPYEVIAYTSNENGSHTFGGFMRANGHLVYVLGAVHRIGTEEYFQNYVFDMKGIYYLSLNQYSPARGAIPYLQHMINLGLRPPSISLWYNIYTGEITNPSLASRYWPSFEYIYGQEQSLTRDLLLRAFIYGDERSMDELQYLFIPARGIKQHIQ